MNAQTNFLQELIIDNFAGGGGASTGIELAIGRPVDVAINHDPASIQMHNKNHPYTRHYCEDVYDVEPLEVTQGRPVALCWFSPDCKHFSKAKGGKPRDKKIRGLAWVAVRWAATVHPRVIILENVEEFKTWGPLTKNGQPDINQKGRTFNSFVNALKRQGYEVQWKELRANDLGAPTIRKRFFLIARCDGKPIAFPNPTHGEPNSAAVQHGLLKPYRTATEIIDWSIPTKSIFGRKKPLADNTLRGIAMGTNKFVIKNPKPFMVQVNHGGENFRGQKLDEVMPTITSKNGFGFVTPVITSLGHTSQENRSAGVEEPLRTIVGKAEHCLTAPYLVQYHTETTKNEVRGQELKQPLYTLDTNPRYGLAAANLCILRNNMDGKGLGVPLSTVTTSPGHFAQQINFLSEYYGNGNPLSINEPLHTITTKDRNALISMRIDKISSNIDLCNWPEIRDLLNKYCDYHLKDDEIIVLRINGADYFIADIGLRMLEPRELYNAQGFPSDYIIDFEADGKRYSKKEQVARCGNSVPPPFAEALVRANLPELCGKKYETMEQLKSNMAM